MNKMKYRLALDLGSTSLGWAMVRLKNSEPCAVIKAGVRIFSDGRNPKDGASLAVSRREARAMRRRRDRLLKRKARMMKTLVHHGFFPDDPLKRKLFETLDPYQLRARGLTEPLKPEEFGRALFHINLRRGFKSNRKTDKNESDDSALKRAISTLKKAIVDENCKTVGEWLHKRNTKGLTVRARYRQTKVEKDDGKSKIFKSYDLYVDRGMIETEFDTLWEVQSGFNPSLFNETARDELKDCLLHQRPLRPVKPGRCTLLPEEERAPLALPSQQRFRIFQELNNLRIIGKDLEDIPLSIEQRNTLADALETNSKRTFTQIRKLLTLSGASTFNLEDVKRTELKGNATSSILSKKESFGDRWFEFTQEKQDQIVSQLVSEENEAKLINWLMKETKVNENTAENIAKQGLPEGYGSLCLKALDRILPVLQKEVITYDKAVIAAGFDHHSNISHASTGEILPELPYYGEYLQRHVGFGTGNPDDVPEKRFGKIANPTVHIGLNQVRTVVNALIKRYGHPSEVIVELARDLKQSQDQKKEENQRQGENKKRNDRIRKTISEVLKIDEEQVRVADTQKVILWEELSNDVSMRICPYSGKQISISMLLSDQVEIEHILPFSRTLDDSLNNKTVATRQANRIKGNRTPWEAVADFNAQGWPVEGMLDRAELMPRNKRYRFGPDGYSKWLKEDKSFLARALNDTRHLSRVAKEYLSLICPQNTRAIPGQMTAMLRAKFGLNDILGLNGEKNRNDHRHHAVDACVIAVTDQGMLQRFAKASESTRERQLNRLVETMPLPWETYRESVSRAVNNIWVSHKPDHGHEGAMHNDTAYSLLTDGKVGVHKMVDGVRTFFESALKVIPITDPKATNRHGTLPNGEPKPYKGYKGDSNYCIEIIINEKGKWEGEVISTFEAYQIVKNYGLKALSNPTLGISGKPLVMRLMTNDCLKIKIGIEQKIVRVTTISSNGQIFLAPLNEANVDSRNRDKLDPFSYISKMPGSLKTCNAIKVSISPIGILNH
jgi:CRISPR-associated endonuclease Csn1